MESIMIDQYIITKYYDKNVLVIRSIDSIITPLDIYTFGHLKCVYTIIKLC